MARDSQGCAGWFKWLIGIVIALLGAGGGIVALLNYQDSQKQKELDRYQQGLQQYQQELQQWNNFSPTSLSNGSQEVVLIGSESIDLESGLHNASPLPDRQWDLQFGCWPDSMESLRALEGVSWSELGLNDFDAITYREIRDANYLRQNNSTTGYYDLYYLHKGNVPGEGYVFFIKTPEGNVAKLQILGYETVDPNPLVCRNMKIRYEVFPFVNDPPRPNPPN